LRKGHIPDRAIVASQEPDISPARLPTFATMPANLTPEYPKRGTQAMDDFDILPPCKNSLMRDHWKPCTP
jgi:hypothetical protein